MKGQSFVPVAALVVLAGVGAPALTQTSPASLLWQPEPLVRPDFGALARIQVQVGLAIDAEGRPTAVEVAEIEPAGVADEEIRAYIEREGKRWRFVPALADGVPVAGEFRVVLRYELDAAAGEGALVSSWLRQETRTERRARLFGRPIEDQRRDLAELVASAERLLGADHRKGVKTSRVVLRADIPDEGSAAALANNVEVVLASLDSLFGEVIAPQPLPFPFEVVVYRSRMSFHQLSKEVGFEQTWVDGLFAAPGLLAFHTELPTIENLLSLLIHETTHAWLERVVVKPGVVVPEWLSEGLAEYVGNSEVRKGKLVPGRVAKGRVIISGGIPWRYDTSDALSLKDLRLLYRKGEGLTLVDLVGADRELFYGPQAHQFYTSAWLLVHFLRHGEKGWEDHFSQLLLAIGEGYDPALAVEAIYGAPLSAFEARFAKYAQDF